jgi:sulfur carrier protein ThiS
MKVTVTVENTTCTVKGETIEEVLECSGYPIASVLVLKEGSVILAEDVSDNDCIELLPVASGG